MSDDALYAAVKQIGAAVESLQQSLREDMSRLREEVRQEITEVRQEITEVRTGVMERLDRLQNSLTHIREDIGVTQATAETARDRDEATRKELRSLTEIVTVMHRQIQRLQTQMRELRGDP